MEATPDGVKPARRLQCSYLVHKIASRIPVWVGGDVADQALLSCIFLNTSLYVCLYLVLCVYFQAYTNDATLPPMGSTLWFLRELPHSYFEDSQHSLCSKYLREKFISRIPKGPHPPFDAAVVVEHKFSGAIGHPVRRGSPPQGTTHAPTPSLFHAHPGKRFQVVYQCQLKPHEAGFNE